MQRGFSRLAASTAPVSGAVLVLSLAWALWPSQPGAGAAAVRLSAKEFLFAPKEVTAPPGEVTFVVKNEGAIEHNFVLEDQAKKKAAEIPILEPSQTLEVKATLQPGTYVIYCSLPGHRDAGMAASLTVR